MPAPDLVTTRSIDELQATVLERGRVLRRRRQIVRRSTRALLVAAPLGALVLVLTIMGSGDQASEVVAVTPETGKEYEGDGLVLERDEGPQLCLGGIKASNPPQCSGIPIGGWNWAEVPHPTVAHGTTWAGVHLRGRYDGSRFMLTSHPAPVREVKPPMTPDFSPACSDPDVVAPGAGVAEWEDASQKIGKLPNRVATWVTNTGTAAMIANVIVRPGSGDEARALVRKHYSGPLCVVERDQPTADDLDVIHEGLRQRLGADLLFGAADYRRGVVNATVVVVTPELEHSIADEFGAGRVELEARLLPVG